MATVLSGDDVRALDLSNILADIACHCRLCAEGVLCVLNRIKYYTTHICSIRCDSEHHHIRASCLPSGNTDAILALIVYWMMLHDVCAHGVEIVLVKHNVSLTRAPTCPEINLARASIGRDNERYTDVFMRRDDFWEALLSHNNAQHPQNHIKHCVYVWSNAPPELANHSLLRIMAGHSAIIIDYENKTFAFHVDHIFPLEATLLRAFFERRDNPHLPEGLCYKDMVCAWLRRGSRVSDLTFKICRRTNNSQAEEVLREAFKAWVPARSHLWPPEINKCVKTVLLCFNRQRATGQQSLPPELVYHIISMAFRRRIH